MNEIRSIDSQILIRVQCLLDLDRLQPPYTMAANLTQVNITKLQIFDVC